MDHEHSELHELGRSHEDIREEDLAERRQQAQTKFIEGLRDEAYKVRDCYTRYSIQALGLISIALAGIVGLMKEGHEKYGLLAGFVILVVIAVFYLGVHKVG